MQISGECRNRNFGSVTPTLARARLNVGLALLVDGHMCRSEIGDELLARIV
jgi:hypothetical protein